MLWGRRRTVVYLVTNVAKDHNLRDSTIRYVTRRLASNSSVPPTTVVRRCTRWSAEEDAIYLRLRQAGMTAGAIAQQLPGRSESAVQARANRAPRIKPLMRREQPWSPAEKSRLVEARAAHMKWSQVEDLFPTRTRTSISSKFYALRTLEVTEPAVKGQRFTSAEGQKILHLRNNEQLSWADVARQLPGRNLRTVRSCYANLTPYSERKPVPVAQWPKPSEIAEYGKLRQEGLSASAIATQFQRTASCIRRHLWRLSLPASEAANQKKGRWSSDEDEKLLSLVSAGFRRDEIARKLNRTLLAVYSHHLRLIQQDAVENVGTNSRHHRMSTSYNPEAVVDTDRR